MKINFSFDEKSAPKTSPIFCGGDLKSSTLLEDYNHTLFPWFSPDLPILWWSPDPRAVIYPSEVRVHKSLKSYLKKYSVKFDVNFAKFIKLCTVYRQNLGETWLSDEICEAYTNLFDLGYAHSVEVYEGDELVGGLYGLMIGKVFCGESMLSLKTNASKVALVRLCDILKRFECIIDAQVMNSHLEFMGAKAMKRSEYIELFNLLSKQKFDFNLIKQG